MSSSNNSFAALDGDKSLDDPAAPCAPIEKHGKSMITALLKQQKADKVADTKSQDDHVYSQLDLSLSSATLPPRTVSWADETQDEIDAAEEAAKVTVEDEVGSSMDENNEDIEHHAVDESNSAGQSEPLPDFDADAEDTQSTDTTEGVFASAPLIEDVKPASSNDWDAYIASMESTNFKPLRPDLASPSSANAPGALSYAATAKVGVTPKKTKEGTSTVTPSLQVDAVAAPATVLETSTTQPNKLSGVQLMEAAKVNVAESSKAAVEPIENAEELQEAPSKSVDNAQPTVSLRKPTVDVSVTPAKQSVDIFASSSKASATASPIKDAAAFKTVLETATPTKTKRSRAQRRTAAKARAAEAAAASSSTKTDANMSVNDTAGVEELQPSVSRHEQDAATVKTTPASAKESKVADAKPADDLPASPKSKGTPILTPVKTILEQVPISVSKVDGVADTLAKFSWLKPAPTSLITKETPTISKPVADYITEVIVKPVAKTVVEPVVEAVVESIIEPVVEAARVGTHSVEVLHEPHAGSQSSNTHESSATTIVDESSEDTAIAKDKYEASTLPKLTAEEKAALTSKEKNRLRREERKLASKAARGEFAEISAEVAAMIDVAKAKAENVAKEVQVEEIKGEQTKEEQVENEEQQAAKEPTAAAKKEKKKQTRPSGAARRRQVKKQTGGATSAAAIAAAEALAPGKTKIPTRCSVPTGVQIGRWNVPWFVLLALFLAQLAIMGSGLYHLMLM